MLECEQTTLDDSGDCRRRSQSFGYRVERTSSGRVLHLLNTSAFSRRTVSPTILQSVLFVNYLLSMKCLVVALLIVAFCAPPFSMGADRPRKIPCKTEANAKSCYWTHGRLMLHEGTPSFRLWKIGTHRMLAIWSGPSVDFEGGAADNEHPEFPANIQRVFRPSKNGIFADFEVCPLEPKKPNVMQAACIESAKNIFIEDFDK